MTADLLRALIRARSDQRTATVRQTKMGWTLVFDQWVLRSARVASPRWFQTLDACSNAARELGLQVLIVELPSEAPPVVAKPSRRRSRKG